MKKKHIILVSLGFCLFAFAYGQDVPAIQELNTVPPTLSEPVKLTLKENLATPAPKLNTPGKIQYQLSAGSQFSRFGSMAYVQPGLVFPVTNRFSTFASVAFIQSYGSFLGRYPGEAGLSGTTPGRPQLSSVVQVGGNYIVNEKLNITGSVWRDFSKQSAFYNTPINVFSPGGTKGMQFRANYKLTDNLSLSGGFRYSNGNNYYNPFYQDFNPGGF